MSCACAAGTARWPAACRNCASAPGPTPIHASTATHVLDVNRERSTRSVLAHPSALPAASGAPRAVSGAGAHCAHSCTHAAGRAAGQHHAAA
eukprot:187275-Chlamydomonas_euryale.AAC.1